MSGPPPLPARRPLHPLQCGAPLVRYVSRDAALERRQVWDRSAGVGGEQRSSGGEGVTGLPGVCYRVCGEKRVPAERAACGAVEENEVGEATETGAGVERVGPRPELDRQRHETNFFGVPRNELPPGGRHRAVCSIKRASSTSLTVTPPALCVHSRTTTLPQLTARSG